jgi:hypothetical protein
MNGLPVKSNKSLQKFTSTLVNAQCFYVWLQQLNLMFFDVFEGFNNLCYNLFMSSWFVIIFSLSHFQWFVLEDSFQAGWHWSDFFYILFCVFWLFNLLECMFKLLVWLIPLRALILNRELVIRLIATCYIYLLKFIN